MESCKNIVKFVFIIKRGYKCGLLQASKEFTNKVRWNHYDLDLSDLRIFSDENCNHEWCKVVRDVFNSVDFKNWVFKKHYNELI